MFASFIHVKCNAAPKSPKALDIQGPDHRDQLIGRLSSPPISFAGLVCPAPIEARMDRPQGHPVQSGIPATGLARDSEGGVVRVTTCVEAASHKFR